MYEMNTSYNIVSQVSQKGGIYREGKIFLRFLGTLKWTFCCKSKIFLRFLGTQKGIGTLTVKQTLFFVSLRKQNFSEKFRNRHATTVGCARKRGIIYGSNVSTSMFVGALPFKNVQLLKTLSSSFNSGRQ